ncbi:hypothetical protein TCAL_04776 [Tigriopus californicus]|uniref:CC2D2A N-terminal C2 domain-containing protein n=1 Tax=Tigriopus californicus TaxID=6832 RepID=A0A553P249_TIGCA|nr:hypothetical protein TCAL_04776 [Tigriopus californicus]
MPRPVKKLEKLEMVESRGLPPLKNKAKKSVSWSPQEKFSEQPPKFFQRQKSSIEEEVQAIEVQAEVKPPKKTGSTQPTPASSSSSSSSDESLSSDEHHSEVRDNFVADVSTPIPEQPNRRTSRIDSLKGLGGSRSLSRQLSSRYVDHLRDESAQANAAFQEHQERKNKRNRMADILVQDQNHADDDEAYDFFTKNWDDLGTTKHDQEDEEDGDEEDGGEEAVGNDDTKTLVKDHYLASKLRERFADYQEILYRKAKLDLDRRIRVLYDAMTELKEKLEIAVQQKEREFQTRRFESYRKEVKVIREQRDEESGRERATIKEILTLWRTMRDIRRRQGYQSTNLKLTIHKVFYRFNELTLPRLSTLQENASLIDDQTQWEQELTREVDEARDDYHDNLEFLTKEYEEELRHWKQIHDMRKAAYKRHKKMKKDSEKGIGSAEVDEIAKDEELLASPEPEKPQPPGRFDEEHVRKMLEEKARQTRRPPGETILTLELSQSSNIDKDVQDNRETSRRHSLSKMKIFVKLFFNGKEVCQSSTKHIGEDFTVPIAQIFPLQITQWPETLKVQVSIKRQIN